jgi:hypothetical protein
MNNKKYFRTKKGLVSKIYSAQKYNSKLRKHHQPNYTKEELEEWVFKQPYFDYLFKCWVESGYKKALVPSCDRLDDYKGYTFDNMRLTTWAGNRKQLSLDIINGKNNKRSRAVYQFDNNNVFIKEYYSIANACRETEELSTNIIRSCIDKTCINNYIWRYKHEC